jgi:2',3'-cyclic-nucleotide 2'-phosphodiesterase (5'-nucleotidase family)
VIKRRLLLGSWAPGLGLALGLALAAQAPTLEQGANNPITATLPDDPDLAKVIAPLSAEIHASYGRIIANAPDGVKRRGGPGEFPLGFLLADVMREAASTAVGGEVRLAVTNAGGIRRDLPAGPVHVGDIYEVIPFNDELVVADYTGAQVVAIVKEAIRHKGGEPVSGVRASVTGSRQHPVISVVWSDGTAIDPAGTFRVATSDYLLGNTTSTLKKGRNVVLTSIDVRQAAIDWCESRGKEGKPIIAPEDPRYLFSPQFAEAIKPWTY